MTYLDMIRTPMLIPIESPEKKIVSPAQIRANMAYSSPSIL